MVTLTATLIGLFTGRSVNIVRNGGPLWLVAFVGWWFVYLWISVGLTGRTVGKAVIGLRVVDQHGGPLRPARAALRVLFLPVSLILGLGLVPAVLGRSRRALHDFVAGSKVEVDWGGRDVMLPVALGERLDPTSNALATDGELRPA